MAGVELCHTCRELPRQWIVSCSTHRFDREAVQTAQMHQSIVREHTQMLHPDHRCSFQVMQCKRVSQPQSLATDVGKREWLPSEHKGEDVMPACKVLRTDHCVSARFQDTPDLRHKQISVLKVLYDLVRE